MATTSQQLELSSVEATSSPAAEAMAPPSAAKSGKEGLAPGKQAQEFASDTSTAAGNTEEASAESKAANRDDEIDSKDIVGDEKVQTEPSFMERRCGLLFNLITFCNRWLKWLSNGVDTVLETIFAWWGLRVASKWGIPISIIIMVIVFLACASGLIFDYKEENNGDKLFTPQDSQGVRDKEYVEELYGFFDRRTHVYATANPEGSEALTSAAFQDICQLYSQMVAAESTYEGVKYTWESNVICVRVDDGPCDALSPLDFFPSCRDSNIFDCDCIAQSTTTSEDILAAVNQEDLEDALGRSLNPEDVLGGIAYDDDQKVTSAEAFRITFTAQNNVVKEEGQEDSDPVVDEWELTVKDVVRDYNPDDLILYVENEASTEEVINESIDNDVVLITISAILIGVFAMLVFSRRHPILSSANMGLIAMISTVMAVLASYGFMMYCGVPLSLPSRAGAVILIAIGVDDSFVIMNEHWNQLGEEGLNATPVPQLISRGLKRSAVSITLTSLTDLVAFLTGLTSSLPAIQDFVAYTAVGVSFDFIFQVTLFVAFLAIDVYRQRANRIDLFSCFKSKTAIETPDEQQKCGCIACGPAPPIKVGEPDPVKRFIATKFPNFIFRPLVQAITMLGLTAFVAVCIWGATQLQTEFNFEDYFVPGNSYVADAFEIRDRYWEGETFPAGVYLKNANADYFANQDQLLAIGDELRDNKWVALSPPVDSWFESFQQWIDDSGLEAAQDSDEFYSQLRDFLDSDAGTDYTNNIIFEDDSRSQIISSEIEFFSIGGETASDQVDSMEDLREAMSKVAGYYDPSVFASPYVFYEGLKVIDTETIRSLIWAALAVLGVMLILLADIKMALLVFAVIVLIDVELLGMMYFIGLEYNAVTTIDLVISLGLSVDYSVHIAHSFLKWSGTRRERAQAALADIGAAVFYAALSTFIAFLPLAASESYIFTTFFQMFAMISSLGGFHGLVILPILLLHLGSEPYEEARPAATKISQF